MSGEYIARRVLYALFVLVAVSLVVFALTRLSGDPTFLMVDPGATPTEVATLRASLGLDRPLWEQYWRFASGVARGDFGESLWQKQPAMGLLLDRIPATLQLAASAMALSVGLGIPLGVAAALRRGLGLDRFAVAVALVGQAIPSFLMGLLLILVFSVHLGWLPSSGSGSLPHLVLPAITLGSFFLARTARITRSEMLEVLGQDYVRTARSKGLRERSVILRHALKNAAIPLVTILGLEIGTVLGGAVITETIFAWPGVGRLVVDAIFRRDFPLVQAAVFFIAIVIVLVNFGVDLVYAAVDPRIRYR
jgi:peptide/nickel transport system permease protein